ncbi:MAG: trigger factor [Desulfobacterales bacterium CG2_30_60_27]|nr:MAG: trigger factor [Desulfobacterales bacterium CG2_30_60_27]
MQVTVESVSGLTRKMKIVVPGQDVVTKLDAAYAKLGRDVAIKGFRKGKTPRQVLEKNFGAKVRAEVADKLIQDTYFDALEQMKLDVVAHPDVKAFNFDGDGSFVYDVEVDVRPEIELGQYKGLEVEQIAMVVDEALVDRELAAMRQQMAPLQGVEDRAIRNGDLIVIDFQGFHDGAPMQQVRGEDYSVDIGSGRNGKEFEELFVGLLKGEESQRTVAFPAGFANPVLAGKTVEFKIAIKDVKERVLPALDDEFAKDAGVEFSSLEDLRQHLRARLLKQQEEIAQGDLTDKIMLKLLEAHDFEVPNRLVAYEINALIKETEDNLERRSPGMTLEAAGITHEQLTEQYKDAAIRRVKGDFLLKKIAAQENITLTDEDMNNAFERVGKVYGMSVADVKQYFRKREDLLPFMNELLSEKIVAFLRAEAVITKAPAAAAATTGVNA